MEHRKAFVYNGEATLFPIEGISRAALAAAPIISSGDITGAVVFLSPGQLVKGDRASPHSCSGSCDVFGKAN